MPNLKTLHLMRHAEASLPGETSDFDRPLTPVGERDARHIGRWMNDALKAPGAIYSSSALRAKLTAEIVMEELHQQHSIQFENELYEASARTFLAFVNQLPDELDCVLIVAHNPTITYLADYLTSAPISHMPAGTLVSLSFDLDSWTLVSQDAAEVNHFQMPNSL